MSRALPRGSVDGVAWRETLRAREPQEPPGDKSPSGSQLRGGLTPLDVGLYVRLCHCLMDHTATPAVIGQNLYLDDVVTTLTRLATRSSHICNALIYILLMCREKLISWHFTPRSSWPRPLQSERPAEPASQSNGGAALDTRKFDSLTRVLSESSSRRSALKGVAGGGAAALFAMLGLRGAEAGDVAAERRRRRRRRRPNTPPVATCVTQVGVALNPTGQANGTACTGGSPAACLSGFCTATICQPCPTTCLLTSGTEVCCPGATTCINGACQTCTTPAAPPKKRRRRRRRK